MTNNTNIGVKKSAFTAKTTIPNNSYLDFVVNGHNFRIKDSDFYNALGVTGSITTNSDGTATPVLDKQGAINVIRNIKGGFGITITVDGNNNIELSTGFSFNETGETIVDDPASQTPVFKSISATSGISAATLNDSIELSSNLTFDQTGEKITDNPLALSPTYKSFVGGSGVSVSTVDDTLVFDSALSHSTKSYGLLQPGTFIATPGSAGNLMNISAGKFSCTEFVGGDPVVTVYEYAGATDVVVQEVNNRVVSMYGFDCMTQTLVQRPDFFTPQEIENGFIPCGVLLHFNLTDFTGAIGSQTLFAGNNLESYLLNRYTAPVSLRGNVYGFNTDLTLNVSGGEMYYQGSNHHITPNTPHTKVLPSQSVVGDGVANPGSGVTGLYLSAAGDAVFESMPTFEVDVNRWDDGSGTLQTVPGGNNWTVKPILNSPITGTTYVLYGRELFITYNDAFAYANSIIDLSDYPVWVPNGTGFVGIMLVKQGTTNLSAGLGTSTWIGSPVGFRA